jgi:hypothetical protein
MSGIDRNKVVPSVTARDGIATTDDCNNGPMFTRSSAIPGGVTTALTFAICLLILCPKSATGQANPESRDVVIINGNPPLTESMVTLYADFDSWVLEVASSLQQRNMVRAKLIEDWRKPAELQNDITLFKLAATLLKQTPEEREFTRWRLQPMVIGTMRLVPRPYARQMAAAYEQTHRPIAPGNPPLTDSLVSRFTKFLCWVLEIPWASNADRMPAVPVQQAVRNALIEDWRNPLEVKKDMDFLNWQVSLANSTTEEREYLRGNTQPVIVKAMRADTSDPNTPPLVAAYDAAHPVIAAGNPPLTRQAADAFTEFWCFTKNQAGGERLDCNQALKDSNAQRLSQTYGGLPPGQQTQLAAMPQTWATLRLGWAESSEADRQKMRSRWLSSGQTAQAAAPGSPADQQAINAALERVLAQQALQRYNMQQMTLRNSRNPDGTRFSPVWLPHRQ